MAATPCRILALVESTGMLTECFGSNVNQPLCQLPSLSKHVFSNSYIYHVGSFAFIEAKKHTGKSTWLVSLTVSEPRCLSFWYYMDMVADAELNVYIQNTVDGSVRKVWGLEGGQGKKWKQANIPILTHLNTFKVSKSFICLQFYASNMSLPADQPIKSFLFMKSCLFTPMNGLLLILLPRLLL